MFVCNRRRSGKTKRETPKQRPWIQGLWPKSRLLRKNLSTTIVISVLVCFYISFGNSRCFKSIKYTILFSLKEQWLHCICSKFFPIELNFVHKLTFRLVSFFFFDKLKTFPQKKHGPTFIHLWRTNFHFTQTPYRSKTVPDYTRIKEGS